MADDSETLAVACALLWQLRQYPQRSDTTDGIACWWLAEGVNRSALRQALEWLQEQGLIEQHIAADTRVRWRRKATLAQIDASLRLLQERAP